MSRWTIAVLLILLMNPADDHLDRLARNGDIQQNAPVKASLEITIDASPEKVWALLTDVKNWPTWQRDITKAGIYGPLQVGTALSWKAGIGIQAHIALLQPLDQFGWTGTAYKAKAIHLWKLQRLPGGRTLVRTDESMDGFFVRHLYSSSKLEESDRRWLHYLKEAAER